MLDNGRCYSFKNNNDKTDNIDAVDLKNEDGISNGIVLKYSGGNSICKDDPSKAYSLNVNLQCGENEGLAYSNQQHSVNGCDINLFYKSKQACPVISMSKFFQLMNEYYYFWGVALLVLGLFLAFFGNKFVNMVIYIMATIAFFLVVSNLFFNLFMEKVHKQWV